jgi:hypothetical protein
LSIAIECGHSDALTEQIDFNASALIAGIGTQAELMPALVLETESSDLTWSEICGETTESVSHLGPSI